MGNHCINCTICGDCLRCGADTGRCKWRECPGWIIGDKHILKKIADSHPDDALRLIARQRLQEAK